MRARLIALFGAVLLLVSCFGPGASDPRPLPPVRLVSFSSCDDLLAYLKGHALERVTPWGLPGQGWWGGPWWGGPRGLEAADAATAAGPRDVAHSTTNVQTPGVDEPDIVKTDGRRLVALARGKLYVLDVAGPAPVLRGSLRLDDVWVRDLLLAGDRALLLGEIGDVIGPLAYADASVIAPPTAPTAVLLEVDLSDPAAPQVVRRLLVDGRYLSARMTGEVARVVVSSYPTGLRFEGPEGPGLRARREALERNREVIRSSTLEDWVPYYVLEDGAGGTLAEGSLLDCERASHPETFSGFGMLTVLTVDLAEGLAGFVPEESVGVVSDGETVYASTGSLYVATQRWDDLRALEEGERVEGHTTQIHRFDISGPGGAAYRSSGEVPGWLLNQFAMDEHAGYLRVASTEGPPWGGSSASRVTVLAEEGGRLTEVGRVTGLGRGERIYAVRFMGDIGYVVTFRQVDPLYVLDLSNPSRPTVAGELKILGYSAYLHPLGDGRLLGVGQDATERGSLKGTQLSLFDVSDPSSPRRLAQVRIAEASSEVEWDHHAFLYWEPEGLVVVPVAVYDWDEGRKEPFLGAQAVRVRGDELEPVVRIGHEEAEDPWGSQIRRSLVVGDLLYTVSDAGVEAADLVTFRDVAWIPLT